MNPDSQSDRRFMPRKSAAIRRKAASESTTRSRVSSSDSAARSGVRAKTARLREEFRSFARVAILSAAEEVLAEDGLHVGRIEEIAQRARVAVGTIYNLVGDRDALIQEIMHARHAEVLSLLANTLKTHKPEPFPAQLHAAALAMFSYFGSHSRFFRLVLESDSAAGGGKLGAAARSKQATMLEIHKLMRELIQRGVKSGALRSEGSELFPALLSGMLRSVMMHDLALNATASAESRASDVTRIFLQGAGT
jgi:AcrR family transcriptional regulator